MNLRGPLLTTTQAAECQVEVDTLARNPRVTSQVSREELCTSKQCGPTSHMVLCLDCYFAERIFSAGVNTVVSAPPPLVSALTSTRRDARDSPSPPPPPPFGFCIQYAIKNWRLERPGNEAREFACHTL